MNTVAIGYSAFNKTELIKQSLPPLLQPDKFDLFIADGSTKPDAIECLHNLTDGREGIEAHYGVRGGSGAAIVYLLSTMLANPTYDYIGLCEMDVVLGDGWFESTMDLFVDGEARGFKVGAASPRCYEDRVLVQWDDWAVVHNTGAGVIIFSRAAAQMVLDQYRVQRTLENRAVFSQVAGVDIAAYWAFRGSDHWLVADWRWDALLASKGLASLALTPSPVTMIGQTPSLEEQGLTLATGKVKELIRPDTFKLYRDRLADIRLGRWTLPDSKFYRVDGFMTVFPHQMASVDGAYSGSWSLVDMPGYGPFGWRAGKDASVSYAALGPCEVFLSGGKEGAQFRIVDQQSGYDVSPALGPEGPQQQVMTVTVPGSLYRNITVSSLMGTGVFYGIRTREPQPITAARFSYQDLPPV